MNINYSSAKTILHLYRKKSKKTGTLIAARIPENLRCRYTIISPTHNATSTSICSIVSSFQAPLNNLEVVMSQGGKNYGRITMASPQLEIVPA